MDYFIIAGEASGDLHGAGLMRSLKEADPGARFLCFGGDRMKAEGGVLLRHYREMAFMGFIDVVRNFHKIRANFALCRQQLIQSRPDVLILIDYPGFNLEMAAFAQKQGIPVFYYILPKVWAWKAWRIRKLRSLDGLFSIFPFEKEYFHNRGLEVHYAGNPLVKSVAEAAEQFRSREQFLSGNRLPDLPLVALLPGSREQEIRLMLPVMTRLAADFAGYRFAVAATEGVPPSLYARYTSDPSVPVLYSQTCELLHHARAALVTSGTATLEAALLKTPQAVLYKMAGGKTGYRMFRYFFLRVDFISLPNLVAGEEVVKEFVMDAMKYETVKPELVKLLEDQEYRQQMVSKYETIETMLQDTDDRQPVAATMTDLLHSIRKRDG